MFRFLSFTHLNLTYLDTGCIIYMRCSHSCWVETPPVRWGWETDFLGRVGLPAMIFAPPRVWWAQPKGIGDRTAVGGGPRKPPPIIKVLGGLWKGPLRTFSFLLDIYAERFTLKYI